MMKTIVRKPFMIKRTVWHLNSMQTNNLREIELLKIELFEHSTVCKIIE